MSSGTTYKALDVTIKKVLVDLKNNWEKEDAFQNIDIDHIFNTNLPDLIKLNNLEPNKENCFEIIKKLNLFLSKTQHLSNQQKLDYCKIERYFMKLYLKEFTIREQN